MRSRAFSMLMLAALGAVLIFACQKEEKVTRVVSAQRSLPDAMKAKEVSTPAPLAPAPAADASTTATAAAEAARKPLKLALVIAGFQAPYYVPLVEAAKSEAAVLGDDLFVLDSAYDNKKEADNVRTVIGRKVDVAIVSPIDMNAVVPSLRALHEAGIPVVTLCNRQAPEGDMFVKVFIGVDPLQEGYRAGLALRKAMRDKGDAVIIEGFPGAPNAIARTKGFERAIEGSAIKIVAKNTGDWNRNKAMGVMDDFLTRFPKIGGAFVHDDGMAVGAIQAVKSANRLGEFPIVSVNGSRDGLAAISAGEMLYAFREWPDWEGRFSVIAARMMANGHLAEWSKTLKDSEVKQEKDLLFIKTPWVDITKENAGQIKASW